MAGQADGDRTDHAVSGMGRAPHHDHHGLVGVRLADTGSHSDQLIGDDPLAPLEPPGRLAAAQLLGGLGVKFRLELIESGFHFGDRASRQHDSS